VQCPAGVMFPDNIAAGNVNMTGTLTTNMTTGCDMGSLASPTTPVAAYNFVDVMADNYHLTAASTLAIDLAPADPSVTGDVDGQVRPNGAFPDYGADEFYP